jgi:hypothetical protein
MQEREQVSLMPTQTLEQTPHIRIGTVAAQQTRQACLDPLDPAGLPLRTEVRAFPQANRIPDQTPQHFAKGLPARVVVPEVRLLQLPQQVRVATLP